VRYLGIELDMLLDASGAQLRFTDIQLSSIPNKPIV